MQDPQQVAASDQFWLISETLSKIRSKLHFIYISNLETTHLTHRVILMGNNLEISALWAGPASK